MPKSVRILADSLAPNGRRATTWELTYHRFVHAELMTHRLFSRNSASSRAIPVKKLMEQVRLDPAVPVWWGKTQAGMQAREELSGWRKSLATWIWLQARWLALFVAWSMLKVGLHKQIANRVLEPWMWITVLVTATEFDNWFKLRAHPDAQPEIAWVAMEMARQYATSTPKRLAAGEWHLPLIYDEDLEELGAKDTVKVCTGRCARVSYRTHDGRRAPKEDIGLHDGLCGNGHWSPFEHPLMALGPEDGNVWSGNVRGFRQYRELADPDFVKRRCDRCTGR